MISGIWNAAKAVLAGLLARETRRMCFAEKSLKPFTPLEWVFPMQSTC